MKLKEFLETGKAWSRLRTSIPGIFILKLPIYRRKPSRLAVELNPVNEVGDPTKRRGLVLRTGFELEAFNEIYDYDKLKMLIGLLDDVNPKKRASIVGRDKEIIGL
jgi:hypothetical protein